MSASDSAGADQRRSSPTAINQLPNVTDRRRVPETTFIHAPKLRDITVTAVQ